jgi:hypothetical protein
VLGELTDDLPLGGGGGGIKFFCDLCIHGPNETNFKQVEPDTQGPGKFMGDIA